MSDEAIAVVETRCTFVGKPLDPFVDGTYGNSEGRSSIGWPLTGLEAPYNLFSTVKTSALNAAGLLTTR